jgi:hypothetical protein
MSITQLAVDLFVLSDRNATVASAELFNTCDLALPIVNTTGASKREQGDIYDQEIATGLAVSRALERMSRQLRRRANAKVREAMQAQELDGTRHDGR